MFSDYFPIRLMYFERNLLYTDLNYSHVSSLLKLRISQGADAEQKVCLLVVTCSKDFSPASLPSLVMSERTALLISCKQNKRKKGRRR